MTRKRAVAYLIRMRSSTPDDIDGLRVADADWKLQTLEEVDRLILDVRAGRIAKFRVGFPVAAEIVVADA